jgi:hypothetical protein
MTNNERISRADCEPQAVVQPPPGWAYDLLDALDSPEARNGWAIAARRWPGHEEAPPVLADEGPQP